MMDIELEHVQTLLGNLQCSKDVKCVKTNLEELCKAKDIGDNYLVCLEGDRTCTFSQLFGGGVFCRCPVRVFIGKEFKKQSLDTYTEEHTIT